MGCRVPDWLSGQGLANAHLLSVVAELLAAIEARYVGLNPTEIIFSHRGHGPGQPFMPAAKEQIYHVVDHFALPNPRNIRLYQLPEMRRSTIPAAKLLLWASMRLIPLSDKNPKVYRRYERTC